MSADSSDERIVQLIRAGDPEGQRLLHLSYGRRMVYMASRYTHEYAEDCASASLLIAVRQIGSGAFLSPGALASYLLTILKRQIAETKKNRYDARRVGGQELMDQMTNIAPDSRPNPEEEYARAQQVDLIKEALGFIEPTAREVLTRFYLKEQPLEQICREMGMTYTQVRLLKSRSKARLVEHTEYLRKLGRERQN